MQHEANLSESTRRSFEDVVLPHLGFGMKYVADSSTDLGRWSPILIPPILIGSDAGADTIRYVLPASGAMRFLRIRAVYP